MKKTVKKLTLAKETVRKLEDAEVVKVQGGGSLDYHKDEWGSNLTC